LATTIESFLIDRHAASLSPHTLKFYRQLLAPFLTYCDANALKLVQDISSDFLRRCLLGFSETRDSGGVHASFLTLRAFFRWLMDEEMMPAEWKNPMRKVKPPKVVMEPL
jgi:site-specific recombinase XerD